MRAVILAVLIPLCLAACGGDDEATTTTATRETTAETAAAQEGEAPEVSLPEELPTELVITDLVEGTGPEAAEGDRVYVRYVGVRSEDGEQFDENFTGNELFPVQLGTGGVIDGWEQGLIGIRQGGRRQLDIPAELAYGDSPQGDVIRAGDALTFVVDAVGVVGSATAQDEPQVELEGAPNQDELTTTDLVVGDGSEAAAGDHVAVQIVTYRADTGERLNSTYTAGQPFVFVIGDGSTISGLEDAVTGMRVGGQRQAQIPFAQAFGAEGRPNAGLPASTDMVVVIELSNAF